jgi:acetamidase/formamidase
MDCRLLAAGTTLLLPVEVDGGLLFVGDTHASQGDGEVCGMAIETMCARATLTLSLAEPRVPIDGPVAITPSGLVTLGFAGTIEGAIPAALNPLLDILVPALGVSRAEALALVSAAADVRVTQLVNGVFGAHALLTSAFATGDGAGPELLLGLDGR